MTKASHSGLMNSLYFEINLTDDCNLRCSYCSELFRTREQTYVSQEAIDKFVQFIVNNVNNYNKIQVNFFGGEPLMNMLAMIYVTEKLAIYPNISFNVVTNGTMLSDYIDFFVKYKDRFSIQISYDGNPNHDKNRCNSSKKVKENILIAKENNLNIHLHSVICPSDFEHFYEAYKDIVNINVDNSCGFIIEFASSYKDVKLEDKELWLKNLTKNLKLILLDELKLDKPAMSWFRLYTEPNALRAYCSAGIDNFSLSFNGNVYKCHGAVYSKNDAYKHLIGSIFDENLDDKLKECTNNHKCNANMCEECKNCETIICYNCHTSNFEHNHANIETEDYFEKWNSRNDEYICSIYKLITKYIKAYDVLKTEVR